MTTYRAPTAGEASPNMTTMNPVLTIMYWVVVVGAGLNLVVSGLALLRPGRRPPWMHKRVDPRRWAVCGLLLSIGVLTGAGSRLVHAPDLVILVASVVALVCFIGAAVLSLRVVQPLADVQRGSTATDEREPDPGRPHHAI
jgi:hypothetical protein